MSMFDDLGQDWFDAIVAGWRVFLLLVIVVALIVTSVIWIPLWLLGKVALLTERERTKP